MTNYHITVRAAGDESLSPLYRALDREFPDLDELVDSFVVTEDKKPLFAAGDSKVVLLEIKWRIPFPKVDDLQMVEKIIETIKRLGLGKLDIVTYEDDK